MLEIIRKQKFTAKIRFLCQYIFEFGCKFWFSLMIVSRWRWYYTWYIYIHTWCVPKFAACHMTRHHVMWHVMWVSCMSCHVYLHDITC